ncbi:fumarylacetoacetate hydrolase family protein, partial [Phyllobacterium sp. P5_D12]
MAQWVRFDDEGMEGFGLLQGKDIVVYQGSMFEQPIATDMRLPLASVRLLAPCEPSKIIALWNNFHQLAAKLDVAKPDEPLYLLKALSSV